LATLLLVDGDYLDDKDHRLFSVGMLNDNVSELNKDRQRVHDDRTDSSTCDAGNTI